MNAEQAYRQTEEEMKHSKIVESCHKSLSGSCYSTDASMAPGNHGSLFNKLL